MRRILKSFIHKVRRCSGLLSFFPVGLGAVFTIEMSSLHARGETSPSGDPLRVTDVPPPGTVHTDHLRNPYLPVVGTSLLFGSKEVTVHDYETFLRMTEKQPLESPHFDQGPDHPVVGVNLADAQAFCRWMTGVERAAGRISQEAAYRLPTPEEWSMAVGMKNSRLEESNLGQGLRNKMIFPWGESWPPVENAGNYAAHQIDQYDDSHEFTAPVGSYVPNQYGIYDLGGNVWEWCDDGRGTSVELGILRGGSWVYFLEECLRASYAYRVPKQLRASSFGFRCVFDAGNGSSDKPPAVNLASTVEEERARFLGDRVRVDSLGTRENVGGREAGWVEARQRFLRGGEDAGEGGTNVSEARARLLLKDDDQSIASIEGEGDGELRERIRPEGTVASRGEQFENSLGLKFIPIGGLPLLFGTTEVRVGDFDIFVRQNPQHSPSRVTFLQGREHPVVGVSWHEAVAFCDWLTEREREEGWITADQSYRLPTDAEWSLVAGLPAETGGDPSEKDRNDLRRFPWGDEWPPPSGVANVDALNLKGYSDPHPYTAEVKTLIPNSAGIFGLSGNVSEWCIDEWRHGGSEKVIRGGSWMSSLREDMLSSRRLSLLPDESPIYVGFRCVLVFE